MRGSRSYRAARNFDKEALFRHKRDAGCGGISIGRLHLDTQVFELRGLCLRGRALRPNFAWLSGALLGKEKQGGPSTLKMRVGDNPKVFTVLGAIQGRDKRKESRDIGLATNCIDRNATKKVHKKTCSK